MMTSTEIREMADSQYAGTERHDVAIPSHPMRVADAKDIFENFGDDFREDVESLVHLIRKADLKIALPNSNYLHALQLTQLMFDHTDSSFCMLTGGAADGFLGSLKTSFSEMLNRIAVRGGRARMIVLSDGDVADSSLKELRKRFSGVFEYLCVQNPSDVQLKHFIVCDNEMVRDEELHGPLKPDSSANEVKAKVHFKNENVAKVFTMKFDSLWKGIVDAGQKESRKK